MQIPEYPRGYCVQMMKKGLYDDILDYLETCDFYIIRFVSQVEFLPNKGNSYKIWHGLAANFNDCFDCCWKLPEILSQFITENVAKLTHEEWGNKTCVACFTEYCNRFNPKMWYMYANEYRGACLVYSISSIAKAINQCYKTISRDEKELFDLMLFAPVFYASKNEAISEKMDESDMWKGPFKKTIAGLMNWSGEIVSF